MLLKVFYPKKSFWIKWNDQEKQEMRLSWKTLLYLVQIRDLMPNDHYLTNGDIIKHVSMRFGFY